MDLLKQAQARSRAFPGLRIGQALFDLACDRFPWALQATGTEVDPFHDDAKIPTFLGWILERDQWENPD